MTGGNTYPYCLWIPVSGGHSNLPTVSVCEGVPHFTAYLVMLWKHAATRGRFAVELQGRNLIPCIRYLINGRTVPHKWANWIRISRSSLEVQAIIGGGKTPPPILQTGGYGRLNRTHQMQIFSVRSWFVTKNTYFYWYHKSVKPIPKFGIGRW